MGLTENVEFARKFAVMVRVQGPDPKGLKMRNHAFHQYTSGITTLSVSGMVLPNTLYDDTLAKHICGGRGDECPALVVTVASIFEPFLTQQHGENTPQGRPELISGVQIDTMLEGGTRKENLDKAAHGWHPAQLYRLIDAPTSALALQSLIEASLGSVEHSWEVGWSLASQTNGPHSTKEVIQSQVHMGESGNISHMGKSTTKLAILGVPLFSEDLPNITISPSIRRGDFLLAVGSPFGVLSPVHFFNSISMGSIANCYPTRSSYGSLLMADIRCLPGMEGCPVFDEQAELVGIMIRPLRQKMSGAEVQLVIPWEAIASDCGGLLLKEFSGTQKRISKLPAMGKTHVVKHESDGSTTSIQHLLSSCGSSPLPIEKAMTSVCLITIDDGVWASGVVLNNEGLILTNAHLLEPWRFGKRTATDGKNEHVFGTKEFNLPYGEYASSSKNGDGGKNLSQIIPSTTSKNYVPSVGDEWEGYKWSSSYIGCKNIRIRMGHKDPWIWCDARVVYVCKGVLDVALLQLEYIPEELSPITFDFAWPSSGSKAFVIGHGLFGPRCGFVPSVCSGVVAKVVKAEIPFTYQLIQPENSQKHLPVMLETTATVHPGASGGAVVNSDGHMIGIVTSNARHGGGTVIPHLNFSIPCSALLPIFQFSKDMQKFSLLQILDQPNEQFSSVWSLMPSLSPKSPPSPSFPQSLLEYDKKEGKGSRFAKFVSERQQLTGKPAQHGVEGKRSYDTFPSKL